MVKSITLILLFLHMLGLNPYKQNRFAKFRIAFSIFATFYMNAKNYGALFFYYDDVMEAINDLYTLPAISALIIKITVLCAYNKLLKKILDHPKRFWPNDKFGPTIEKEMIKARGKVDKVITSFIIMLCIMVLVVCLLPLGDHKHDRPPIYTGIPECDLKNDTCFQIIYAYQVILTIIYAIPLYTSLDLLFFTFVGETYCSLHLLKLGLKSFDVRWKNNEDLKNINMKIGDFINQHDLILAYIKMLKEFFSEMLLLQAAATLFSIVYCLYALTANGFPPPPIIFTQVTTIVGLITFQFFYYSLGGTIIMEQSFSVAGVVYEVEWWRKVPPGFRDKLRLMMMRSQRSENLYLGKLAELNLMCFLSVVKTAVSMYTLLLNVQHQT